MIPYRYNPVVKREEVIFTLKQLLANTYLLYIQTQGAHWNITGSDFPQLHTLFQTQYTELALAVDLLAEHIRTYDAVAPGSAAEFIELATIEEGQFSEEGINVIPADSRSLLSMLISHHRATAQLANKLGQLSVDAIHTQNLAADRISAHEKAIWMLSTTVSNLNKYY